MYKVTAAFEHYPHYFVLQKKSISCIVFTYLGLGNRIL